MHASSRRLLIRAVLIVVLAILAIGYGASFLAQNHCRDAGGRWDNSAGLCSGAMRG
jgi:hypothetical protein